MEAARAAVSKFTSSRGHHTTVEESVNPAITRETVKPHRHEEATQAIDREVHQHHHHTTVQPLTHTERLPEKHTHNMLPTEHREFRHDNEHETKQRIEQELGRFKDSTRTEQTHHTQTAAASVTGEHVHHHVHETVVPVVHKEVIQPEVVHTTVPVHETHHAAAQHHGLSALPMKTLDEFKKSGGILTGGKHGAHEEYEGQPRQYNDKLSTTFEKLGLAGHSHTSGTTGTTGTSGISGTSGTSGISGTSGTTGISGTSGTSGLTGNTSSHHHQGESGISRGTDNYSQGSSGIGGIGGSHTSRGQGLNERGVGGNGLTGSDNRDSGVSGLGHSHTSHSSGIGGVGGRDSSRTSDSLGSRTGGISNSGNTSGTSPTGTGKKPSLLDRLNPMKDADGDGKRGLGD